MGGALIALAIACAMNLFAYWNSDKMVLRMYGAREVDGRSAPGFYGIVEQLASEPELVEKAVAMAAPLAGKDRATMAALKRGMYPQALALLEGSQGLAT